ncbi:MAG: hypothetical protein WA183_01500 [Chthoniobacterales bacterium]
MSKLVQPVDGLNNVIFGRSRIDRTKAQGSYAFQSGGCQERVTIAHHGIHKSRLEFIVIPKAKADGRQLSRRKNLPALTRTQLTLGQFGKFKSARDRLAKGG